VYPVSVICEFSESGYGKRGNRFVMKVDVVGVIEDGDDVVEDVCGWGLPIHQSPRKGTYISNEKARIPSAIAVGGLRDFTKCTSLVLICVGNWPR